MRASTIPRWVPAALPLGILLLVSAAAGAQGLEEQAAAPVAAAVCSKRVVLLGELPEHGHARGFGIKAQIVERLVTRCGFRVVLFEAGSYDFFGFERGQGYDDRLVKGVRRGPGDPRRGRAGVRASAVIRPTRS